METLDPKNQFEKMKKDVVAAFSKALNIKGYTTKRNVVVRDVWVDDNKDSRNWEDQRAAIRNDKTWGVPVYAALDLTDSTGKVLSSTKKLRVATLPKNTVIGSFIVGGKHYQVASQLRRKPGIYVVQKESGDTQTEVHVAGRPFHISYDRKSGVFGLLRGTDKTSVPMYPVLSRLGISDSAMAKAWGDDVLRRNKAISKKKADAAVLRMAKYFTNTEFSSADDAAVAIAEHLDETEVRSDVTKTTIGREISKLSPSAVLSGATELLRTYQGKRKPDGRQSLDYKKVMSPSDIFRERFIKENGELAGPLNQVRAKIARRLTNRKDPPTKIDRIVQTNELSSLVDGFFTQSSLAEIAGQRNPIEMMSGLSKVTILGQGAIADAQKVREDDRSVHPSHLGFIDPVHTPESDKTGTVLHFPLGVAKKGDSLVTRVVDPKSGKRLMLTPAELRQRVVSFPDQFPGGKAIAKRVKAIVNNETVYVDASKVNAVLASPKQAFSVSGNTIPFFPSANAVRQNMATKILDQALPLTYREAPLVQVEAGNTTIEKTIGASYSVAAQEDGVVQKVTPNRISIKTKDGVVERPIYNNLPLMDKSFLHAEPTVKEGDTVAAGQTIADSNFTRDGTMAIGTNLRAAYIPYKGYNFEDGIVITESAAKKLTSEHLHEFKATAEAGDIFSLSDYTAFKNDLTMDQQEKLDKDGVVRKGQVLTKGDPIWVGTRENRYDPDYIMMKRLTPSLKPRKGYKEQWDSDFDGVVTDVVKRGKSVKVYIKTLEPAQVGDKLSNRHAAKGIITKIIPDGEAPYDKDGKPVDILLNPHGVVTRINPSQILETAAAKVAESKGKPIAINNFSGENYAQKVADVLAKEKIGDTETLFDPHSKEPLGEVLVGPQYIIKLSKQAKSQFSARGRGTYDMNRAPASGGEEGGKALDALTFYGMLAHGSRANIREMATYKAEKNDEFWNWLSAGPGHGLLRPPPRPTFAYQKFEAYMKGAGVNIERNGSKFVLSPMTDREVKEISSGEVKDAVFVRSKDLADEPGGLTDPNIFGVNKDKWGHIELAEPIPNPLLEEPIKKLTGLKQSQFDSLVRGQSFLDPETGELTTEGGLTGGAAIKHMLSQVDVDAELEEWTDRAKNATTPAKLDQANKQLRYLKALKSYGLRPEEAYIQTKIPVIPTQFRPIMELPDGRLSNPGVNTLYRDVALVNNELAWQKDVPFIPEDVKAELRKDLYDGVRAVAGLGPPVTFFHAKRAPKGFVEQIKGPPAKEGFFQYKVLRRTQDLVGRGTIIPDPKLGLDEVGLPEDMAWKIYEPFVVRRLVSGGRDPRSALDEVEKRTPLARSALDIEVLDRPVILNRAPSLHKLNVLAFNPKIIEGRAVKIPPLIVKGYNADFDGDRQINSVLAFLPNSVYVADLNYWQQRKISVTARFRETIGYTDELGHLVVCDLSEFPHLEEKQTKGHIDFHPVPEGIKVVALDEQGGPVLADVSNWSFHRQRGVEIVTLGSGRQIVTDDDERAVYGLDASSLEWCRRRPTEAQDQFVPVASEDALWEMQTGSVPLPPDPSNRLKKEARCNFELGYFLGALVGDGWAAMNTGRYHSLCLASIPPVTDRWKQSSLAVFKELPTFTDTWTTEGKLAGSKGSGRTSVGSTVIARWVANCIGHGAKNKHLPPFWRSAPEEFRQGLLSGLWDTDGSLSYSKGKAKPQFMCNYSSASVRLVQEIQQLLRSMSVTASITATKTPRGDDYWMLNVSTVELHRSRIAFQLANKRTMAHWQEFRAGDAPNATMAYSRYRLVPMPSALAKEVRRLINRDRHWSLYAILGKAVKNQYMSKQTAGDLLGLFEADKIVCRHPLFAKWVSVVRMPGIHFERVKNVEVTDVKEDGYDLTVPGYETFMSADGIVLSNTMTVHVPIMPDAVEEAWKMRPSKHLYNPGSGRLTVLPQNEAILGLYYGSQDPKQREAIMAELPESIRAKYGSKQLDKRTVTDLLTDVSNEHPDDYGRIVDKLKAMGDDYAYKTGFTVSLNDLLPKIEGKDRIFKSVNSEISKLDMTKEKDRAKAETVLAKANKELDRAVQAAMKAQPNNLNAMVVSGARGGFDQLKQTFSAPFRVNDHKGQASLIPITKSFAEGLPFSDYWSGTYGARSTVIDKQLQTADPGAFTKDVLATAVTSVIADDDCKTSKGVTLSVKDQSDDIVGRTLAKDLRVKGTTLAPAGATITPSMLSSMRDAKVGAAHVRSPLTCKLPKGLCAKCHGLTENGTLPAIGDNVGANAGTAMSEPLTQMVLRTFHFGGLAGTRGILSDYDKVDKLLKMPRIKDGKAVLAPVSGRIEKIEPAPGKTGREIYIGNRKDPLFVPEELWESGKVRVGSEVKRGDALSHGIIQPDELAEHKGLLNAQLYVADELQKAYGNQGIKLLRRPIETVLRSAGNTTKILDPGESDFLPGDVAPWTVVEDFNEKPIGKRAVSASLGRTVQEDLPGIKKGTVIDEKVQKVLQDLGKSSVAVGPAPIRHKPFLKGLERIPILRRDWMAQLGYQRLSEAITHGAATRAETDIHSYSPVPAFAYGAEFGAADDQRSVTEGVY